MTSAPFLIDISGQGYERHRALRPGLARTDFTQYDVLNRPVTVTANYVDDVYDPARPDEDLRSVTSYDANGNVTAVTRFANAAGLARTTVTAYDPLNRPVTVTANYADGVINPAEPDRDLVSVTEYNGAGQVTAITHLPGSGLARTTRTAYDPGGRPVRVTANYVDGVFDPARPDEDLVQITVYGPAELRGGPGLGAAVWITTSYAYDNLGRLVGSTWPLTAGVVASSTTRYDALGRVVEQVDTLGRVTRTEHDALGRPVTVTANYVDGVFNPAAPDKDLVTVTAYDAAGNRVQVRKSEGVAEVPV
jgi:YD repeat-containing protein